MKRHMVWGAVSAAALTVCAEIPVSVTKGENCPVPSFKDLPFVQEGEPAAIRVPNTGWTIDWQREFPKGSNDVTGLAVEATEVELRGEKVPAIRITCTPGKFRNYPLVALPFEIDFTTKPRVVHFDRVVRWPDQGWARWVFETPNESPEMAGLLRQEPGARVEYGPRGVAVVARDPRPGEDGAPHRMKVLFQYQFDQRF